MKIRASNDGPEWSTPSNTRSARTNAASRHSVLMGVVTCLLAVTFFRDFGVGDLAMEITSLGMTRRRLSIFIAETMNVEHVSHSKWERSQRLVHVIRRHVLHAMPQLPQIPDPIDHAVVRPENRIESGEHNRSHIAPSSTC